MGKNILFLSDITQSSLNNAFVEAMPWLSFGRKNIGYLYAIANGATVIWDFDDDNILKFWMKGATPDDSLEIDHFIDDLNGNIFLKFLCSEKVTKFCEITTLNLSYVMIFKNILMMTTFSNFG